MASIPLATPKCVPLEGPIRRMEGGLLNPPEAISSRKVHHPPTSNPKALFGVGFACVGGTYLIGMDMIEWYGDYLSPLSRFPRYIVVTIDEEDIVSTSSPITEAENRHLSLSPNPATNNCRIRTNQLEHPGKLTVNNLQGQLIYNAALAIGSTSTDIDVSTWPAGIYFVNLESEEGSITRKLVVTNDR